MEVVMVCWENSTRAVGTSRQGTCSIQADSSQGPVSAQLLPGHLHPTCSFKPTHPAIIPVRSPFQGSQSSSLTFAPVPVVQIFPVTHWNCPGQLPGLPLALSHIFDHTDSEDKHGILPTCLFSLLSQGPAGFMQSFRLSVVLCLILFLV